MLPASGRWFLLRAIMPRRDRVEVFNTLRTRFEHPLLEVIARHPRLADELHGVELGLRDIILPGEMKTMLNQVITAEKEAQASLIRRREETAATRGKANTARRLADQPP